jgi:hypothetical protein
MRRTHTFAWLLLVVILAPGLVAAEPTPGVRWLMNEPASLFDIGMMRLRDSNKSWWTPAALEEISKRNLPLTHNDRGGVGAAVYSWNENAISLDLSLLGAPTEPLCSTALDIYKNVISPTRSTASPASRELTIRFLTGVFDHVNHTGANRPKDLDANLINLIVFTVGISDSRDSVTSNTIFCSSKLFDTVPTFQKYGRNK